ncbi:ABC transporter ATP-binding protein [Brachybacterium huguangmaarense]|uniref:ABC transporter ATP-binding protein n=1 Tax=Brachybacterium huguangmaarense TaxID=1652028 RepID=A0ABY6G5T3_9MICO|nr:ABC transporter ATP-binding protein [Brachybacterium huguangmaarense]UYG18161.1 ABC transporter ATP-binding protein [Brachybacterium huguangmaarense]
MRERRAPRAAAVEFRDVAVLRDDVLMLDDATGAVAPGHVLALTGANGAGKTTLLRVIAGLVRPTGGSVRVQGRVPDDRDRGFRASLAALIGPPQTARDLTIDEHLRFIAATWGAVPDTATAHADELLDALAISPLARRYPHELSSGQSQLVSIALTLARPADVLLLDEPEQRLDADRLGQVIALLRARAAAGCAIVLASHSPRLVEELADDRLHLVGEV